MDDTSKREVEEETESGTKLKEIEKELKNKDLDFNYLKDSTIVYSLKLDKGEIILLKLDTVVKKDWYAEEEYNLLIQHAFEMEIYDPLFKTHLTLPLT